MRRHTAIFILCVTSVLFVHSLATASSPEQISRKITRVMRELQARYHYLGRLQGEERYYTWTGPNNCGGLLTPPFPPDDWYSYRIKESMDPEQEIANIIQGSWDGQSLVSAFFYICGGFVHRNCWVVEGKDENWFSHNYGFPTSFEEDFPKLFVDNQRITVDRNNYSYVLDTLYDYITRDLIVLNVLDDVGTYTPSSYYDEGRAVSWFGAPCEEVITEAVFDGWGTIAPSPPIGVGEYTERGAHLWAWRYARRGGIWCDMTKYTGKVKSFLLIKSQNEGFSNTHQDNLQRTQNWQQWGNPTIGQDWYSPMLANFQPEFSSYCLHSPIFRGWSLDKHLVYVWPDFEIEIDSGITFQSLEEEIYKDRDETFVYTAHEDCPDKYGEIIDMVIPVPWDIEPTTRLSAMVRVTSDKTKDYAYVTAGGWDGSGFRLELPEQIACIGKTALWDEQAQSYRLKLSIVGLKGGPKQLRFKVALWYQQGWLPNLDTRCAAKEFTFTASPNHFECCAQEDKCGPGGCYSGVLEFPELKKFENNDIQVFFPVPSETYIFQEPRPEFIRSVTLSEHNSQNPLNLIDPEGSPLSLNSVVVLRYDGGLGFVYEVPSSWWHEQPSGEGTFKYAIDGAQPGNILQIMDSEEYQIDDRTGIRKILMQADGSEKIEYYYDPDYPDRIWKIVHYDLTGYSAEPRERFVWYDEYGRITYISDGGGGCTSCSGDASGLDYVYDAQGNVLQEKNAQGVVLYEYDYDAQNRMIAQWYGPKSEGILVKEVVYTDSSMGTAATHYRYVDDDNYRLEVEYFDVLGRLHKRARYENLNENPQSPMGRFFVETFKVWPPSDYDPSIQAYWKLDEKSGGWALDSSLYKRHGILRNYSSAYSNNSEFWNTGVLNNALQFGDYWGEHQVVKVHGFKGVVGSKPRTVSVWIKPTSAGRVIRWGGNDPNAVPGEDWEVRVETTGALTVDIGDAYVQTVNSDFLNPSDWRHIAVVLNEADAPDLSNISIFIDGNLANATYSDPTRGVQTSDANDVSLGGAFTVGSTDYCYHGHIDEVMLFGRALTSREIAQLYQYQQRQQEGEYVETTIAISPKGNPDGTGPRRETIRTYTKDPASERWYLGKQEERIYGFGDEYIRQAVSEYEPVYRDGVLSTRLKKAIHQGAETVYEYDQTSPMRTQNEIQSAVSTLSGAKQLKRWYDYDGQGRIIEEREYEYTGENPDIFLVSRHYQYDSQGNLIKQYVQEDSESSIESQVVEYKYNGFNEEIMSKSAEGVVRGKEYDSLGRILSEFTFADPNEWNLQPAQFVNKLSLSLPEQDRLQVLTLTRYEYGSNGQIQFIYRAKCNSVFAYCNVTFPSAGVTWATVEYEYDDYGNRRQIKQYVENLTVPLVTSYSFNRLGEQERVIQPTGRYQRTIRDGRSFVKQEIIGHINESLQEEPSGVTSYVYDENGNLEIQINHDQTRVQKVYDEYDRIKTVYRGVVSNIPPQPED